MLKRRASIAGLTTAAAALAMIFPGIAGAVPSTDTLVTTGSPASPFSQNKQNEPAVAIDPSNPSVMVAGSNDNIDEEACNAGDPTTCPFTPGVGVSGVYFSFDSGATWTQPTYTGWSARNCLGPAPCTPQVGPIGTLPHYFENGLVSDGDPAVAFGPRPGPDGTFSWANGSRLYYANLTSNFSESKKTAAFKGFEAIAVSRSDDVRSAAADNAAAWMDPVVISRQNATTFSDKEQVWADNASSSRFFGNVYVCWADFRGQEKGHALPVPLMVARSTDGGSTWTVKQVGPATSNAINSQPDGCTIRTDSVGNVYVFGVGARGGVNFQMMYKSTDGGVHYTGPSLVSTTVEPGVLDPVTGRPVMDGIAGARNDLAFAPSVSIANGAPDGAGATNEIVMTWSDGRAGLNHEQLMLLYSTNGGATWTGPTPVAITAGDRPYYTAPAISPNGHDLYIVYNAFTTPYRNNTTDPRSLVGVVIHATVTSGAPGAFTELHRSPPGDPRASSQNNLVAEFLGDYVYAAATNSSVTAVWNDTRNAAPCDAINAYRASLQTSSPLPAPPVQQVCPATFGNSDIWGGTYTP